MATPATPPTHEGPEVSRDEGIIALRDGRLFASAWLLERFVGRVLNVEGVRSVALDRSNATATIHLDSRHRRDPAVLGRLSGALRHEAEGPAPSLPRAAREGDCTVYRHGAVLSTCEVLSDRPGRIRIRHEAIANDPGLAARAEALLAAVPGVRAARLAGWTGTLLIRYDPDALNTPRLLRLAEEALEDPSGWVRTLPAPTRTRFSLANTNLGIAALADFVVPMLAPVSAALLVGTNFRTFGAAYGQVRTRRLGLPVLYTTIVVATVASGQFLASAMMTWMFRFWHGRLRLDLAAERRRMLDESLPRPRLARLVGGDGPEVLVPIERLRPGDQIVVEADEAVPADGRIVAGEGIVDERSVRGLTGASRKRPGEVLLAGSTVLAGSLRVEIAQSAERSLASTIGRALVAATSPAAGTTGPTLSAEAFAEKAVGPTLATAGVGLLLGGLGTAGAILRPDYATGPGLSSPMETLRDVARCARRGIVVRAPDAFERLAACDVIVLDDAPGLRLGALEVVRVHTRMPEADLLRYAASAFLHLADERSAALVEACRDRRSHLLDLPALDLEKGVTVAHGERRIRVRDHDSGESLVVEADGVMIGLIEFGRSGRPAAAPAVRRLRELAGVPIVLVSQRSTSEVAALASALGVDGHQGDLSVTDRDAWLASSRSRGLRAAFVGEEPARTGCEVTISLGGDIDASGADAVLLRPDLDLLAGLWEVAAAHADQARSARRFILLPNLLCVTGAFLFGATPLTSVVVSNLGTLGLYGRAVGSLRGPAHPSRRS